jgi:hypothetical protein
MNGWIEIKHPVTANQVKNEVRRIKKEKREYDEEGLPTKQT